MVILGEDTQLLRIRFDDGGDRKDGQDVADRNKDVELTQAGAAPGPQFVDPVTAVLVAAGVLAAAKFVMDWWERRKGGVVIDMRSDRSDNIYRDKDLPAGYVLIFPADGGDVKVEVKDFPKDATERLLSDVISGVLGTAEAVKEAVDKIREEMAKKEDGES